MLFSAQAFVLLFLPATLSLYYGLFEQRQLRQAFLVLASLVFYGFWDVRFVPFLVALTFANWGFAEAFRRSRRPAWLVLGVILNLAMLVFFKYTNFLASIAAALVGQAFDPFAIILPLGISFFVFQKISYLVDLYRGDSHFYPLLDFFLFVTFFPQLIAGPIVRHDEIVPQFHATPRPAELWENLSRGLMLFTIGLGKKVWLADGVAPISDPLFQAAAGGTALTTGDAWIAALSYTLQIYFDFSGYSDMAIGLALMFGLRLPLNFNAPYRATSIRNFWRRWHITLSRFLRDYLYVPLGGNRAGAAAQARNVVVTMLLGGLWHGAGWTYVIWGGLNGMALAVNGAWARQGLRLPPPLGWAATMSFVIVCWVMFRAPTLSSAVAIWRSILGLHGWAGATLASPWILPVGVAVALLGPTSQRVALELAQPSPWLAGIVALALVATILQIGGHIPNAFIYFQF